MNLPYPSVREFAVDLKNKHFKVGYHLLPWNRFNTEKSHWWWLSSESANPVFHLGKIVIGSDQDWIPDGEVFVGFNVEKGLIQAAAPRQTEVMQDDWYWHDFLDDMTNEAFQKAYSHATHLFLLSGLPVEGSNWGDCLLEISDDALTAVQSQEGDNGAIVQELAACQNFRQLQSTLKKPKVTDYDWRWVLVAVGRFFTLDPNGTDDTLSCVEMIRAFHTAIRS